MASIIKIADRKIGENCPVLIVAEISANHGQNFKRAIELIREAKKCGADAVKFQTYTADTLTVNCNTEDFKIDHPQWGGKTLHEFYKKTYTPWDWFKKLKKICDGLGIIFFSTAFDKTAVDFLEELNVPLHKIASFELTDLPLIEYAAKTKKPLMLSTGMATINEIRESICCAKNAGAKDIILLKCTSTYPARPQDMNLRTLTHMKRIFKLPVGLSDHSLGIEMPVAAVSLGANVIEKHFTLSRRFRTADNFFSLEPDELKAMVRAIRNTENSLGDIKYGPVGEEKKSLIFRRSLYAVKEIKKGKLFSEENIRSIRPAYGLKPRCLPSILGRKAKRDIRKGEPLSWALVDKK